MIEQDTIRLLRECDAGVKMAVGSINDVVDKIKSTELKDLLIDCKNEHEKIKDKIELQLNKFGDDGKEPGIIAKSMSWMKTKVKISIDYSDNTISDLITNGCNMGVKSLNKYLNQYKAADEFSKNITKKLIALEKKLVVDIRQYL